MARIDWADAEVSVRVACPACDGSGSLETEYAGGRLPAQTCPHCGGSGRVEEWVSVAELARALARLAEWGIGAKAP